MALKITVLTRMPQLAPTDVLAVPVHANQPLPTHLSAATQLAAKRRLDSVLFKGDASAGELIALPGAHPPSFLAVLGCGSEDSVVEKQVEGVRRAVGRIVQEMRRHLLRHIVVDLTGTTHAVEMGAGIVEACDLATYRFTDYLPRLQQEQESRSLQKITLVVSPQLKAEMRQATAYVQTVLPGVELTRHLVNQPAATLVPRSLVEIAKSLKKKNPKLNVTILDRKKAHKAGFNAFLAVARGSAEEPFIIHLTYKPPKPKAKIVFIGKGITFDSGGLSLKPANKMETMKVDMAGAATVLGLFSILSDLRPAVEVHGIVPACENMPSGSAYRPGDVLTSMSGKTIEVVNTDAEGRIILADALTYAGKLKPDAIVDLATLTGACTVALGETYAGLFSNNKALEKQLLSAAHMTGEGLTALPLPEEYHQFIESRVADVSNAAVNHPIGGAITAALFLQDFVETTPWAHIDMGGPSYAVRPALSYFDIPGATGYGVRLLAEYLKTV